MMTLKYLQNRFIISFKAYFITLVSHIKQATTQFLCQFQHQNHNIMDVYSESLRRSVSLNSINMFRAQHIQLVGIFI